ncbi:Kynurenine formamidase [bioreactor metagenome]|uniref:Kynurenine formamidase n=1 Tax=bioreactor metagenome TaxID=1076179 RepID=A0A644UGQ7_9ZZZZ|nr:cyclase family protein [Methanobrevibacter sp.]MEA4957189.1 cyclase family protein [Methanobrevibacter sp.]
MKYIDLSHKLNKDTQVYPGDPKFVIEKFSTADDDYFLSNINGSPHTGTHIDAPYHYIKNGKKVDDLDINTLIGKATILKTKREIVNDSINIKDIDIKNPIEKIVILKTEWYKHWGNDDYFTKNPYISNELADMLIENKVKGVAIDTCSVDKIGETKIHKRFLKNDIWIVENLTNLNKLSKNNYYSYFIPMNIDAEASYIRAFVKDE